MIVMSIVSLVVSVIALILATIPRQANESQTNQLSVLRAAFLKEMTRINGELGSVREDIERSRNHLHSLEGRVAEVLSTAKNSMHAGTLSRAEQPQSALPEKSPGQEATVVVPESLASSKVQQVTADAVVDGATKLLPGALTADERIVLSDSSRPMVQIRWRVGSATAEVLVNPEYRFAEINAELLNIAFDLEGTGGPSYETVIPAEVEWGPNVTQGRVRKHGRLRATA
jgi:hypothetical protein